VLAAAAAAVVLQTVLVELAAAGLLRRVQPTQVAVAAAVRLLAVLAAPA
jgi:hypothetical protein